MTGPIAGREAVEGRPPLDEPAFGKLAQRHRRELHVHCYRMLASFHEAEDAVQETFLRAWRNRERFEGESLLRAWLYRIALTPLASPARRLRRARNGNRRDAVPPRARSSASRGS